VRRYAIALLTKLTLTHPYGIIHGGELSANEWTQRYDEVAAELASMEQRPVDEGAPIEEEDEDGEEEDDEDDESAILKDPGVAVDEDGEIDASTVGGTARTKTSKGSKRSKKSK
jgi:condensin complex subunit 1